MHYKAVEKVLTPDSCTHGLCANIRLTIYRHAEFRLPFELVELDQVCPSIFAANVVCHICYRHWHGYICVCSSGKAAHLNHRSQLNHSIAGSLLMVIIDRLDALNPCSLARLVTTPACRCLSISVASHLQSPKFLSLCSCVDDPSPVLDWFG